MPKLIINEVSCVFIEIDRGKPDKTSKKFVLQKRQKGNGSCFFYSMNMVRKRYNTLEFKNSPERKNEKEVSELRKLYSQITQKHLGIISNLKNLNKKLGFLINNINIKLTIEKFETLYPEKDLSSQMLPIKKHVGDFLREFQAKFADVTNKEIDACTYAEYLETEELSKFILKVDGVINLKLKYKEIFPQYSTHFEFDNLDIQNKFALTINLMNAYFYSQLALTESNWHPDNKFEDLLDALRTNGPMVVGGKFGKIFYNQEKLTPHTHIINDKKITCLSFKPNSYTGSPQLQLSSAPYNNIRNHAVVIVGGNIIENKPYVYFHDPLDESYPDQERTTYIMSYKNFCERSCTLQSIDKDKASDEPNQKFALHNPSFKNG